MLLYDEDYGFQQTFDRALSVGNKNAAVASKQQDSKLKE